MGAIAGARLLSLGSPCAARLGRAGAASLGRWAPPRRRLPLLDQAMLTAGDGHPVGDGTGSDSARMVLALESNIVADGAGVPAPEAECRVPCVSAAGGRGRDDVLRQHVLRTDDGALDRSGADQRVQGSRSVPVQ